MTADELARLKELESKATKGPWFDAGNKIGAGDHGIAEVDFDKDADRKMLIELRNAATALIALAEWAERARATFNTLSNVSHSEQLVVEICEAAIQAYPEGE